MATTESPATAMGWGSDAIAALLRELNFSYVALNPGSSYRGLHDSIVNFLGNENPKMLLCLHEGHAVSLAHGYAKATDKPMLVALHSQVGLMHATMALYIAWVDRVPIVVLGANGPVDAHKRRPFRDWVHTTADNGALVRNYTKWDDQPASVEAALISVLRANQIARSLPAGPTYVCLDVTLQEDKLDPNVRIPEVSRFAPPNPPIPTHADIAPAVALLRSAKRPVILVGRTSRSVPAWNRRVALAESLGAQVITDLKVGAGFPTDHPLHVSPHGGGLTKPQAAALQAADVVLSLDFVDLGGALAKANGGAPPTAKIISCSLDQYVHNGWSMDYQDLPPTDCNLVGDPDALVSVLLDLLGSSGTPRPAAPVMRRPPPAITSETMTLASLNAIIADVFSEHETCWIRLKGGEAFTFRHPLDYLGGSTGVGIGPGVAVGAALALRDSGSRRLPAVVLGDGDFLMGGGAIWTATANRIPLLVIVANNRSFHNDELHQEHIALERGRPVERKWIGQRLDDPAPDIAGYARVHGAVGIGPVTRASELPASLRQAIVEVRAGHVCIVDAVFEPSSADARS